MIFHSHDVLVEMSGSKSQYKRVIANYKFTYNVCPGSTYILIFEVD